MNESRWLLAQFDNLILHLQNLGPQLEKEFQETQALQDLNFQLERERDQSQRRMANLRAKYSLSSDALRHLKIAHAKTQVSRRF